jgi:hypothetical protein
MSDLQRQVAHLHTLLSYLWEDVNLNEDGIVEVNTDEVGQMMDMINDIAYITDTPLDNASTTA